MCGCTAATHIAWQVAVACMASCGCGGQPRQKAVRHACMQRIPTGKTSSKLGCELAAGQLGQGVPTNQAAAVCVASHPMALHNTMQYTALDECKATASRHPLENGAGSHLPAVPAVSQRGHIRSVRRCRPAASAATRQQSSSHGQHRHARTAGVNVQETSSAASAAAAGLAGLPRGHMFLITELSDIILAARLICSACHKS